MLTHSDHVMEKAESCAMGGIFIGAVCREQSDDFSALWGQQQGLVGSPRAINEALHRADIHQRSVADSKVDEPSRIARHFRITRQQNLTFHLGQPARLGQLRRQGTPISCDEEGDSSVCHVGANLGKFLEALSSDASVASEVN